MIDQPGGHQLADVRLAAVDPRFLARLHVWLRAPLEGCTQGTTRAAGVVVGELVANAFRHAAAPYRVRLTTTRYGNLLRMAVTDSTPGTAQRWRPGRGLHTVRELCRRWGVVSEATGKTVWAELPVKATGRFPPARKGYASVSGGDVMRETAMLVRMADTNLTLAESKADVRGRTVVDRDGDEVGMIEDLIIDEKEREVRLLRVGSGKFLGLGERKVLIPVEAVTALDDQVHVDTERELVASSPVYDPDLELQQESVAGLYEYYGMVPYWHADYRTPGFPFL